jgi:hypothetical protein
VERTIVSKLKKSTQCAFEAADKAAKLILEASVIIEKAFEACEYPLDDIECRYSHKDACFYITRVGGGALPYTGKLTQSSENKFVTHIALTREKTELRLKSETVEFLNGLIERPFSGFVIDTRMLGGGVVIGEDGKETGEWPGLAFVRFQVHSGVVRTTID